MTRLVVLKEHGFKQADSSKEDSLAQKTKKILIPLILKFK
jgi:hypothetical protein